MAFSTDKSEGERNSFSRRVLLDGEIADIPKLVMSANGNYQLAEFKLENVTEARDADGVDLELEEPVRVTYLYAPKGHNPKEESDWYDYVVPRFQALGVDIGKSDELESMVGKRVRFEEEIVPARWPSGQLIYPFELDEDGERIPEVDEDGVQKMTRNGKPMWKFSEEPSYERQDGTPNGILLPTVIGSETLDGEDARDVAERLLNEFEDYQEFRKAALKEPAIANDTEIKREIMSGKFSAA